MMAWLPLVVQLVLQGVVMYLQNKHVFTPEQASTLQLLIGGAGVKVMTHMPVPQKQSSS